MYLGYLRLRHVVVGRGVHDHVNGVAVLGVRAAAPKPGLPGGEVVRWRSWQERGLAGGVASGVGVASGGGGGRPALQAAPLLFDQPGARAAVARGAVAAAAPARGRGRVRRRRWPCCAREPLLLLLMLPGLALWRTRTHVAESRCVAGIHLAHSNPQPYPFAESRAHVAASRRVGSSRSPPRLALSATKRRLRRLPPPVQP